MFVTIQTLRFIYKYETDNKKKKGYNHNSNAIRIHSHTLINIKKNRNCCGKQQYIYAAATTVNVVQIVFVVVSIVRYQHLLPRVEVSF